VDGEARRRIEDWKNREGEAPGSNPTKSLFTSIKFQHWGNHSGAGSMSYPRRKMLRSMNDWETAAVLGQ
jgi:hypothetical protein